MVRELKRGRADGHGRGAAPFVRQFRRLGGFKARADPTPAPKGQAVPVALSLPASDFIHDLRRHLALGWTERADLTFTSDAPAVLAVALAPLLAGRLRSAWRCRAELGP